MGKPDPVMDDVRTRFGDFDSNLTRAAEIIEQQVLGH